jgi:hypothetical protein
LFIFVFKVPSDHELKDSVYVADVVQFEEYKYYSFKRSKKDATALKVLLYVDNTDEDVSVYINPDRQYDGCNDYYASCNTKDSNK